MESKSMTSLTWGIWLIHDKYGAPLPTNQFKSLWTMMSESYLFYRKQEQSGTGRVVRQITDPSSVLIVLLCSFHFCSNFSSEREGQDDNSSAKSLSETLLLFCARYRACRSSLNVPNGSSGNIWRSTCECRYPFYYSARDDQVITFRHGVVHILFTRLKKFWGRFLEKEVGVGLRFLYESVCMYVRVR